MNEWDIYRRIKGIIANIESELVKNRPVNTRHVDEIMECMRKYYRLKPRIPDSACSNMLGQLTKIATHLPKFPDIVGWIGVDGLKNDDWKPNEFEGKTYPSLALKTARAMCKWVNAHPEASEPQISQALEWAEVVRKKGTGDDVLWLNWDVAMLLRRQGDFQRASELLTEVIKAKRSEFWVWAEAGRIFQSEQPDLALACFCRALECPAEAKFLVRTHQDLAILLAEQGEDAQASLEVNLTMAIREAEGWPLGRSLEELIAKPWYNPSAEGAEAQKAFYARHSSAALTLCFDIVETKAATCIGEHIPHVQANSRTDRKPKPIVRYAIKDDKGVAWSIVGPKISKMTVEGGTPLTLVVGRQHGEDRQTIIHVGPRIGGTPWDSLEQHVGVVVRLAAAETSTKVFVDATGDEAVVAARDNPSLRIGDGVQFLVARNPKNGRLDAFNVTRQDVVTDNVRLVYGQLRRNTGGFAFVSDVFVAPFLVSSIDVEAEDVTALAVLGKHPSRNERTWRAISLDVAISDTKEASSPDRLD